MSIDIEITHEAARAVLGCAINCGWARGMDDCDYYGPEEKIGFVKDIISGKSNMCPDGIIMTTPAEAIGIVNGE